MARWRLALSHTCRSLRQEGQRWFSRVRVTLSSQLDCACLAGWLRSHGGAEACVSLAKDSDARLLYMLTSDSSELRGVAVRKLKLLMGPEMDASQLRNLAQLTSLKVMSRYLRGSTDSLGQLAALQRLQLWNCLAVVPPGLAALTRLTCLRLGQVDFRSVGSQNRILPQLVGLRELMLHACELVAVPTAVTALTALTALDFSGNRLEQPEGLMLLAALTQLQVLDLTGNPCDIPEGLSAVTGLTELWLQGTRPSLATLDRVLPRLTGLQFLELSSCGLASVPMAITALTALTGLSLSEAEVQTSLQNLRPLSRLRELLLDVSEELPQELTVLQALEELSLIDSRPVRGWQHLLALPRLRRLNTRLEPPPAVVDHVEVIDLS